MSDLISKAALYKTISEKENMVRKILLSTPKDSTQYLHYSARLIEISVSKYEIADMPTVYAVSVEDYEKIKKERNRFLNIAYNAIILGQLDEIYDKKRLLEELGCSEEEYDEIMG